MNCGYWTKAIALKRVPEHPHFPSPGHDRSVATSGKPDSFGDWLRRCLEELPPARIVSRDAEHSEDAVASHAAKTFSAGATLGSGRDALGLSHLTYRTTGRFFLHLLDLPPFPCSLNVPLNSHGVNN